MGQTSLLLFTGFPWSITGRLHRTYVSSHGVLPFPSWIRESTDSILPCTSGILYAYIHLRGCIVSMSTRCSCLDRTDSNKLHRRLHMDCIEEYILQTTFHSSRSKLWFLEIPKTDRCNKLSESSVWKYVWLLIDKQILFFYPCHLKFKFV